MLTVLVCTSATRQRNQLRSGLLQRGYWRGVAAVKYNSDALGHLLAHEPEHCGPDEERRKTFTRIDS
jgi:hypothetical protein